MDEFTNSLYWAIFMLICMMTCIIFMNFIIAEVSASYETVKETLQINLLMERGELINEAEDMIHATYKNKTIQSWNHLFPRFIIKRELD